MKVGLIGDISCQGQKIVDAILSNSKYELIYLNLNLYNTNNINCYDLENYCNDVDILFTLFEKNTKNDYLKSKYGSKVKMLNIYNFSKILAASWKNL